MKKILIGIVAVALMLFIPSGVFAASESVSLSQTDLDEAMANASNATSKGITYYDTGLFLIDNDNIVLETDITLDGKVLGFQIANVNLDLNGKTITYTNPVIAYNEEFDFWQEYPAIVADNALTIGNGSIIATNRGAIVASNLTVNSGTYDGYVVPVVSGVINGGTFNYVEFLDATVTINGGTFASTDASAPLHAMAANLTINDGTFTATLASAMYFDGDETSILTINGGTFTSTYDNGFEGAEGTYIITGGTFTGGYAGIAIGANDITISGGKFIASGEDAKGAIVLSNAYETTFSDILKDGYKFSNGNDVTESEYFSYLTAKETEVVKDITYYTVSFDANGKGVAPENQIIEAGAKVVKPANLEIEGYNFDGWYIDAACTNAYDFEALVNNNFTLYAKWTEVPVQEENNNDNEEEPIQENNNEEEPVQENNNEEIMQEENIIPEYVFLDGMDQVFDISKNSNLAFRFNMAFSDFSSSGKVYVDNLLINSNNYNLGEGSTIVTFKDAYSYALSLGKHTLTVELDSAKLTTEFTITKSVIYNPSTGDNLYTLIGILVISAIGMLELKLSLSK